MMSLAWMTPSSLPQTGRPRTPTSRISLATTVDCLVSTKTLPSSRTAAFLVRTLSPRMLQLRRSPYSKTKQRSKTLGMKMRMTKARRLMTIVVRTPWASTPPVCRLAARTKRTRRESRGSWPLMVVQSPGSCRNRRMSASARKRPRDVAAWTARHVYQRQLVASWARSRRPSRSAPRRACASVAAKSWRATLAAEVVATSTSSLSGPARACRRRPRRQQRRLQCCRRRRGRPRQTLRTRNVASLRIATKAIGGAHM
mmetsp:Transcript_98760/g.318432  ORF Transcript_98760/g.318432 Transcript_98760/m.318432 type:complete len:256 (-) Transcript_98760:869-1636(-)